MPFDDLHISDESSEAMIFLVHTCDFIFPSIYLVSSPGYQGGIFQQWSACPWLGHQLQKQIKITIQIMAKRGRSKVSHQTAGIQLRIFERILLVASSATISKPNFMAGDNCNQKKKDRILPAQEHTTPLGSGLETLDK